jgi:hypothetical protein
LSWAETPNQTNPATLGEYLWSAGLPELNRLPDFPKEAFFKTYTATYLERDVRQDLNDSSVRDFYRFV